MLEYSPIGCLKDCTIGVFLKLKTNEMIYIISRTSGGDKPCDEAVKRKLNYFHTRTVTEKFFNEKFSKNEGLWRSKGKNHTITDKGYITRQEEDKEEWTIEINTIDDLQRLIDKYDTLVIGKESYGFKEPFIEIYDSYRE